jgi:hypothetical protein
MTTAKKVSTGPTARAVTSVLTDGLWLATGERRLFLPFSDFPWFKDASIQSILRIEEPYPGHFYWPDLDVDLGQEAIEHPDRFPLKYR